MAGYRIVFASAALAVALAPGCRREIPAMSQDVTTTEVTATTATRPAPPPSQGGIILSSAVPGDITFGGTVSLPSLQKDFDVLSWNSFISLNWPADANGVADPGKMIGKDGDGPTVWERFSDVGTVFLPDGAPPQWQAPEVVPDACKAIYRPGMRLVSQTGKAPASIVSAMSQPFNTGPLIDQDGDFSRFQIVVNKPMFDFIVANHLYSRAGQKGFKGPIKFPCGQTADPTKTPPVPYEEGAIMVKASWKIIDSSEKVRFHTSEALVYSAASANPTYPATCSSQFLGLVGLHIVHKTDNAPQWVWSTFEHMDNAPTDAEVKSGNLKASYNYYNPKCAAKDCPPNQVPPRPWDPTKKSSFHSQVVRLDTFTTVQPPQTFVPESAQARNADALALLTGVNPGSVWANYQLISTQWPTAGGNDCNAPAGDPLGLPAPTFLGNSTLETYIQGTTPRVSSSCVDCHNNAATTASIPSDFTYVLQRAQ